jgi:medium-chain acyl-[acyl-carrier-protein] hydrolase
MLNSGNSAFVQFGKVQNPRLRLFCFPYAGASARNYHRWQSFMPADVELWAVELPGRGGRSAEPFADKIDVLAEQLVDALEGKLDVPFIFFGHSMGATLAFLCARVLRRRALRDPDHLVVSARVAPHRPNPHALVPLMTNDHLITLLRDHGGTAPEILAEPELMALFLPVIRADYRLLATHVFKNEVPLKCPITAIGGLKDKADAIVLKEWDQHTSNIFGLKMFGGGHFFVNEHSKEVIGYVLQAARTLSPSSVN